MFKLPIGCILTISFFLRSLKISCNIQGAWSAALTAPSLPYDLDQCIAYGGSNHVWEAHRKGARNAGPVILKLEYSRQDERNEDGAQLCRRMHLLSQLVPAHYGDCYAVGRSRGELWWYELERMRGQPLNTFTRDIAQRPPQLASLRGAIGLALRIFDAMDATMPAAGSSSSESPPFSSGVLPLRFFHRDVDLTNIMLDPKDGRISLVDLDISRGCHDTPSREMSPGANFPSCAVIQPRQFCLWYAEHSWRLFRTFLDIVTQSTDGSVPFHDMVRCDGAGESSIICKWAQQVHFSKMKSLRWCNSTLAASDDKPKVLWQVLPHARVADPRTPEFIEAVERFLPDIYKEDWRRALSLGLERAFLSAQRISWPPLFIDDLRRAWTGLSEISERD